MDTIFTALGDKVLAFLPNLLTAILIFLASLYAANLLAKLIERVLGQRQTEKEVTILLSQLVRWSLIVVGSITALQRFFDVTAFLAGLGILGFTIGFALQDIMQNFVAGIILLIQKPFKVGDFVEIAGYMGSIQTIAMRTTEIRDRDGLIVIIPNANILSNPITNYTRAKRQRIGIPVGVSYGASLDLAQATALEAIKLIPGIVEEPKPGVVSDSFGDSAINLIVYFWIDTKKVHYQASKDVAVRQIKAAFDREGIEIPFPIQTVYLHSDEEK